MISTQKKHRVNFNRHFEHPVSFDSPTYALVDFYDELEYIICAPRAVKIALSRPIFKHVNFGKLILVRQSPHTAAALFSRFSTSHAIGPRPERFWHINTARSSFPSRFRVSSFCLSWRLVNMFSVRLRAVRKSDDITYGMSVRPRLEFLTVSRRANSCPENYTTKLNFFSKKMKLFLRRYRSCGISALVT